MSVVRFSHLLVVAALLAGCSSIESRIKKNEPLFQSLPSEQRELILHGQVNEGMGPDAVFLAWGNPAEVANGSADGRTFEEWRYFVYGQERVPGYSSMPVRTRDGRYFLDYIYDPAFVTYRRPWRRVVFEKGKVISWESLQDR